MLEARGLVKTYRRHEAVRGVDLHLRPGRVLGLVGANGAGKTTTIKMLAGLVEPTSGTVELQGTPTLEPASRARIGYLPEESPLYDELTPRAYLAFFAALYETPRAERRARADALLNRLGLEERDRERPLGEHSKGMRRKVAIARTLLHDPDVVLLDEPTSGLDPFTAAELDALILELRAEGKAVLLSAHNLHQIETLCDEVLIMARGAVVARGTLAELRGAWGRTRYVVHATVAFPGSEPQGTAHVAELASLEAVEAAFEAVRKEEGTVLDMLTVQPGLDEIVRRAAGE